MEISSLQPSALLLSQPRLANPTQAISAATPTVAVCAPVPGLDESRTQSRDTQTIATDAACPGANTASEADTEAEALAFKRQQASAYLQLYVQTCGAPEEKLDQEAAAEAAKNETDEDEEDELKKMRRGAKDAMIVEDPEKPGQIKVMVRSYDREGKPHYTRTHSVDTGGGQNDERPPGASTKNAYAHACGQDQERKNEAVNAMA